jgi:nitroimidazol reductase NimA-like FMN-containing flavoprotein (pyridoxamine 5'-phosphate oxidase superfamily)
MNQATRMMVELDRGECLRLISMERFGRLAVNMTGWAPLIRPVNYVYDDYSRSIIIRTADGAKL